MHIKQYPIRAADKIRFFVVIYFFFFKYLNRLGLKNFSRREGTHTHKCAADEKKVIILCAPKTTKWTNTSNAIITVDEYTDSIVLIDHGGDNSSKNDIVSPRRTLSRNLNI